MSYFCHDFAEQGLKADSMKLATVSKMPCTEVRHHSISVSTVCPPHAYISLVALSVSLLFLLLPSSSSPLSLSPSVILSPCCLFISSSSVPPSLCHPHPFAALAAHCAFLALLTGRMRFFIFVGSCSHLYRPCSLSYFSHAHSRPSLVPAAP